MTDGQDASLVRDRMLVYQLLSTLLISEPTCALLDSLRSSSPGEGKLGEYLAGLPAEDLEQARIDAAADFAALFLGMSAHPVPPYESVYTSPEHLLMQEARDQVLACYRSEGFAQADGVSLPEDHLATEFEFMAKLCEKELGALQSADVVEMQAARASQAAFLKDHLLVWVPDFCDDVRSHAQTGLYAGLADLITEVLQAESEELEG